MRITVLNDTTPHERRVALVPQDLPKLVKGGHQVVVQAGAGDRAFYSDAAYEAVGATIAPSAEAAIDGADIIFSIQRPPLSVVTSARPGATIVAALTPSSVQEWAQAAKGRGVHALALELVPRITRAQSMDILSSQATISGNKAVLMGAAASPKLMPMLSTAAGTLASAKAFVLGAGVAGLQAIATARRLGAQVSGFDVRPAAQEQITSLGASVLKVELAASAEGSGGYAKEQTADDAARTQAAISKHLEQMDLVVTTAAIPGRRAPLLIPEDALKGMKPGAVIVDLAAETGGNCALTKAGETVEAYGVTIIGPVNLPSSAPLHASQLFARNLTTLLGHLVKDGQLVIDPADEITGAMLVTK